MGLATERTARVSPRIAELGPDDAEAILELDRWAFASPDVADSDSDAPTIACFEWDRTRGAYLPDIDGVAQLAGINSVYSVDLPVPGSSVACGALTWVGVHPVYRRRGVLTAMMADHLRAVHERGEPVSALHAAEATIYGRFGYGAASQSLYSDLPRGSKLRPVPGADEVRIRLETVEVDRHADVVGDCYEAARAGRPGMVSRNSTAQRRRFVFDPPRRREGAESMRIFVAEADDEGPARGYALFRRTDAWVDNRPTGVVKIREFVARDPAAARALWGRLLDLDLSIKVQLDYRPTDDPLFQFLLDRRAGQISATDNLWVRLVDLPAALAARRYSTQLDVVLEVRDELCPWNAGRWRLIAGPDHAQCTPSTDPAAFALDIRDLGAAYLGSVSLTGLADAGLITVTDATGFDSAARAFSWPVAAFCGWVF
ncbi:MAG TPA: GNAT family N-acetyltransferase [Kineosporiaceae bacterium]|nr:GNAT family N-acetyltransferase [Kineosporiaceae bacterium]